MTNILSHPVADVPPVAEAPPVGFYAQLLKTSTLNKGGLWPQKVLKGQSIYYGKNTFR